MLLYFENQFSQQELFSEGHTSVKQSDQGDKGGRFNAGGDECFYHDNAFFIIQ